jgi:hypothetical protein
MKRKLALTAVLAVALAVVGYAQKPDFSGVWTPDAPAAAAPAGGGGGGGGRGMAAGPMTVTQKGDSLVIERTVGENKVTATYKLDGTESVNKQQGRGGEVEVKSTAKWDGSKLTIVSKQAGQDGTVRESSQTWSLEGGNLVVDSTRPGRDGAPMTTKVTYKKTT